MVAKIDLSGRWSFCLDKEKSGWEKNYYNTQFDDSILLPTTVSEAKKGTPSSEENTYFLTDPYQFEGFTWYSREVAFDDVRDKEIFLVLERTRVSHVWIDNEYVGTDNSLCTSHRYQITSYIHNISHRITIMVDNTSYPVKGGHMTSPDTQTNWNGITGGIYLEVHNPIYLTGVRLYPDPDNKLVKVQAYLNGSEGCTANVFVTDGNEETFPEAAQKLVPGNNEFIYILDETANLWSEHSPNLYALKMELNTNNQIKDRYCYPFGLRSFKAAGKYFEINERRTFLRGKHEALIFPKTGYAPTDLKSWMNVFTVAKSYGINHYRFHTCCPPEAAFTAADMFGIYLEPELPFWGTVTENYWSPVYINACCHNAYICREYHSGGSYFPKVHSQETS
jgi:beta-galactosidase/beta-glucuronidase